MLEEAVTRRSNSRANYVYIDDRERIHDVLYIMYFNRSRRLLQKRNAAATLCTSVFSNVNVYIIIHIVFVWTRKKLSKKKKKSDP